MKSKVQIIIEDIEDDIRTLCTDTRLCNPLAEPIAIKYDLHGSIDDAIAKLREIKQIFVDDNYTEKMLADIIKRDDEYVQGMFSGANPYKEQINDAWKTDDTRKFNVMQKREWLRRQKLHDKKECICFL